MLTHFKALNSILLTDIIEILEVPIEENVMKSATNSFYFYEIRNFRSTAIFFFHKFEEFTMSLHLQV